MHISGSYLKDVSIPRYQANIARVYHFGDHEYPQVFPGFGQQLQPGLLQALKAEG